MLAQLLSFCLAALIFSLFICVPGWVLAFSTDLFGFRQRPIAIRASLALSLSFAICPILVYLAARLTGGFAAVWILFGVVWLIAAVLVIRHGAFAAVWSLLSQKKLLALMAAWFIVCAFSEIDLVSGNRVFLDLNTIDGVAHIAFTDALTRTGVPPNNPFVLPGGPVHLFYYYLWYLMCSLVDQLGGAAVPARAAVQAGTFYIGLGLAAIAAAIANVLDSRIMPGLRASSRAIPIGLLLITGLDLIPWSFLFVIKRLWDMGSGAGSSLEWWNEQVTAWLGGILMSPHHEAGVVICFTGALLLTALIQPLPLGRRILLIAITGVTFASGAGVSFYVTFTFGVGLLFWTVILMLRRDWVAVSSILFVGLVAIVLYMPFGLELRSAANIKAFPLSLTVRSFQPVDYWLPSIFKYLKTAEGAKLIYVLRLLFLPLNYFLELGYFFAATWFYWRWRRALDQKFSREEQLFACAAAGSILVCTFLRSTFRWNDLGYRGFLVAQFVLLFWAIPLTDALFRREGPRLLSRSGRLVAWTCLVIGLAGTVFEVTGFRFNAERPPVVETAGMRDACLWIGRNTPPDTIVLFNPETPINFFSALYLDRQTVMASKSYGTFFAVGDKAELVLNEAAAAFGDRETLGEFRSLCQKYDVGAILVEDADPLWKDRSSWVWRIKPSFETATSRVFLMPALRDN